MPTGAWFPTGTPRGPDQALLGGPGRRGWKGSLRCGPQQLAMAVAPASAVPAEAAAQPPTTRSTPERMQGCPAATGD